MVNSPTTPPRSTNNTEQPTISPQRRYRTPSPIRRERQIHPRSNMTPDTTRPRSPPSPIRRRQRRRLNNDDDDDDDNNILMHLNFEVSTP